MPSLIIKKRKLTKRRIPKVKNEVKKKKKNSLKKKDNSLHLTCGSHNDDISTPKYLYDDFNKEFNFTFDPCPINGKKKWMD